MQTSPIASILLIEDDQKLSGLLENYFNQQGLQASSVNDGALAVQTVFATSPDIVILDLMLPGKDGLSICREIRSHYSGKILVLTASDDDLDQVAALEMGADDYVIKPIQPRVLLARVRMLLRREDAAPASPSTTEPVATSATTPAAVENSRQRRYGALLVDSSLRQCQLSGQTINLTPGEFDLLWILASHPDEILPREELVKATRGIDYDGLDRTIDNKVANLRKKLGDNPSLPRRLITVRGKGYLFVPDYW